jgi:hypothetical protein
MAYTPMFPKASHKKTETRNLVLTYKKNLEKFLDDIYEENSEVFLELGRS